MAGTWPRHWRWQFGGKLLGEGKEIWTNTINFSASPLTAPVLLTAADRLDYLNAFMNKLRTRWTQLPSQGGLGYTQAASLDWGKFNEINELGKYTSASTTQKDMIPIVTNTFTPYTWVPQVSMVVTFKTAVSRGLASRGRIYVPMPQVGPGGISARLDPAMAAQLCTNWASFIKSLADLPGIDGNSLAPHIVSGVNTLGRTGAINKITDVWLGDLLDTQRSRRNALEEIYIRRNVEAATV